MRITSLAVAAVLAPAIAFAAGSGSTTPPKTTKTSQGCEVGQVYDKKTKLCVDKSSSLLDDDSRYEAVRELAYAQMYDRALGVLDVMDQADTRVMTYRGFIARKTGDMEAAMTYYTAAIEADANNILARSYMGQGMVQAGDKAGAKLQLAEIRQRGGSGTWAETSLARAIKSGATFDY